MNRRAFLAISAFAIILSACSGGDTTTDSTSPDGTSTEAPASTEAAVTTPALPELRGMTLELVTEDIPRPSMIHAGVGDDYMYLVDKLGTIRVFDSEDNNLPDRFINIRDRVIDGGIEQGLLGMAIHPDYQANHKYYLYYVNKEGSRTVSEFTATLDPPTTDTSTEKVLYSFRQPTTEPRHYGGMMMFGPDGYLWISSGDGAKASENGQNAHNFFGVILRLDVDGGDPYGIPSDNPFVDGVDGAPEVWAYGLRNPWRFFIDPVDRMIYIGDVGQSLWEEINVVSIDGGGYNFGWDQVEGPRCFREFGCDQTPYDAPAEVYSHDEGISVTAGVVYRGTEFPELFGHFIYSDWGGGLVRSFRFENGEVTDRQDWSGSFPPAGEGQINTFGIGHDGEIWIGTFDGKVYRLHPDRG
jgi:glucose/arabinose dehydrogenase